MPVVISDTTVLNYLSRIGQFGLLRLQFQKILIPPAVLAEMAARTDLPGIVDTRRAISDGWLEIRSPQKENVRQLLWTRLDLGELQAIALAQEFPAALLLMDEAEGRAIAGQLKLNLIGTIGILLQAQKTGAISKLKPMLDDLTQQHGFRLGRKIYEDTLREAGEWE